MFGKKKIQLAKVSINSMDLPMKDYKKLLEVGFTPNVKEASALKPNSYDKEWKDKTEEELVAEGERVAAEYKKNKIVPVYYCSTTVVDLNLLVKLLPNIKFTYEGRVQVVTK